MGQYKKTVEDGSKEHGSMKALQKKVEQDSGGGLSGAFLSGGYRGHDTIGMLANKPGVQGGFIVYDVKLGNAVFIEE